MRQPDGSLKPLPAYEVVESNSTSVSKTSKAENDKVGPFPRFRKMDMKAFLRKQKERRKKLLQSRPTGFQTIFSQENKEVIFFLYLSL